MRHYTSGGWGARPNRLQLKYGDWVHRDDEPDIYAIAIVIDIVATVVCWAFFFYLIL